MENGLVVVVMIPISLQKKGIQQKKTLTQLFQIIR